MGLHSTLFTSSMCPAKVRVGVRSPTVQTSTALSVPADAKVASLSQSAARTGAEWKANCCLASPVEGSQRTTVLSSAWNRIGGGGGKESDERREMCCESKRECACE